MSSSHLVSTSWTKTLHLAQSSRKRRALLPLCVAIAACNFFPGGALSDRLTASYAEDAATTAVAKSSTTTETTAATATAPVAPTAEATASPVEAPATVENAAPAATPAVQPAATPAIQPAVPTVQPAVTPAPSIGRLLAVRTILGGKTQRAQIMVTPDANRVADVLQAMGIKLNPLDRVQPAAQTVAYNGMAIRVTRITAATQSRRVTIAPETLYMPTTNIPRGARQRVQVGLPGAHEIVERVWTKDGKVTLRERVSQRVALQPRPTIVALGTRTAYLPSRIPYHRRYARAYGLASRAGSPRGRYQAAAEARAAAGNQKPLRAVRSLTLVATGYSPHPSENGGYTVTATGLPIGYGAAAVDPRVIPLGTKLYIEGYGYAFACDTGGAIKGKRIDLAFDSYYIANTKGRKKVRAWILQ